MHNTQRVAWSVADWAEACSCSRVTVHRLISQGKLRSRLLGRKRLILTPPEEYVESLATTGSGETV
jgi:predicted site-specific integrase-resolvase